MTSPRGTRQERGLQTSRGQRGKRERLGTRLTLEYFGNRALCLSRSRFHLSSVGPCEKKKTLQKAKKLFKVSLLSLSKIRSLIFFGKTSRISASSFPSSSVICVKIFKHGPYFLPRKGYDSVSTSASFSFEQS